jgi:hypothetical protein
MSTADSGSAVSFVGILVQRHTLDAATDPRRLLVDDPVVDRSRGARVEVDSVLV